MQPNAGRGQQKQKQEQGCKHDSGHAASVDSPGLAVHLTRPPFPSLPYWYLFPTMIGNLHITEPEQRSTVQAVGAARCVKR